MWYAWILDFLKSLIGMGISETAKAVQQDKLVADAAKAETAEKKLESALAVEAEEKKLEDIVEIFTEAATPPVTPEAPKKIVQVDVAVSRFNNRNR